MKCRTAVLAFFVCASTAPAAPVTLQFENAPFPRGSRGTRSLTEGDFLVSGDFSHNGTQNTGRASNSSSGFLSVLLGGRATITRPTYLEQEGPNDPNNPPVPTFHPFDALSVDVAEYSLVVGVPATVHITGTKADGTTVNTTFTTDGIFDGIGGQPDFETYYFPPAFSNLVALDFDRGYSFDNVQVEAVPEPHSTALAAAAILLCNRRRRRRRS